MQRYPDYTQQRLRQLAERMKQRIYAETKPVDRILVSDQTDRIPYAAAQSLAYRPARTGEQFGPLWATFWFRCEADVPSDWAGSRVDLLWESHSEATLWMDARSIQGINQDPEQRYRDDRPDAILLAQARGSESVSFQIEMACNRMFGSEFKPSHRTISPFVLDRCEIGRFDPRAWELYYDFFILQQLVAEEPKDLDKTWGGLLLAELNRFANLYRPEDRSTWAEASGILKAAVRQSQCDGGSRAVGDRARPHRHRLAVAAG